MVHDDGAMEHGMGEYSEIAEGGATLHTSTLWEDRRQGYSTLEGKQGTSEARSINLLLTQVGPSAS